MIELAFISIKYLTTIIGVFGAMKAGAIYVSLDANAPAKRLAYITPDCRRSRCS